MESIKSIDVKGKRVLVRCDFNVPVDTEGHILDDFKIKQTVPTIQYLIQQGAKVILMSHLDPHSTGVVDSRFNMAKIAQSLSEYLNLTVAKADECVGTESKNFTQKMKEGWVLLLENLKFYKEETENDQEFAKKLSELAEVYVNDAFASCHREYASMVGVPKYLPSATGLLLEKELENLGKILRNPQKPLVAIVGGAKIETKAGFVESISKVADTVIVSGLIKKGIRDNHIALTHPEKIMGPEANLDAPDIDQKTIEMFCEKIATAKTVVWNGPFGKFEEPAFKEGTFAIANCIVKSKAFCVAGGGETVEFLNKEGLTAQFSWVSTGGGAMLGYLTGEPMPGLEALK